MKKFLPYILIIVILVGILTPVTQAYAQFDPYTMSFIMSMSTAFSGGVGDTIAGFFAKIAWLLMSMMSWLLWLAGVLLNYVMKETVLTMKEGVDKMTGINIGWKVIRDVMNIGFIFLLVYEGIMMIIGQSGKDKVKKYIFSIVLAALLINFSLFFTKILIDASNVVTVGLYNNMIDSATPTAEVSGNTTTDTVEKRPVEGLSAPFMNKLKFQQLYEQDSFETISQKVGGGTNMLIFFLMGTILFFIMAFVFFAISIMFIIRYITLLILLMTSPIAYMGSAIPGMSTYSKQWWESLKGQLLFAPIYMLLTMIVLKLIESDGFIKTDNAHWSDIVIGTTNTANVSGVASNSALSLLLNFTVIIGLAIASLVVAKSSATKGSGYIKDATAKLTAFAGGAVMGGAAMIGRNSAGRLGNRFANSEKLKDFAFTTDENGKLVAKSGLAGFAARTTLKTSAKAAKGTFDARNTSTVGTITGSSALGINLGKVNAKNNFKENLEAKAKKEEDFVKTLKPSDVAVAKAKADLAEKEEEMSSSAYKTKEETAKREYLNSNDYKNSQINTDAVEAEEKIKEIEAEKPVVEQKLKDKKAELEELKRQTQKIMSDTERKNLTDSIKAKQDEIDKTQQEIEDLNKEVVEKNKLVSARQKYVDTWQSDEQKVDEKIKMELIKTNEELKGAYAARVGAYADSVAEGNKFWNVVTNGIGYNTSSDRMVIANKIRGLSKQKSVEQEAKELIKKMKKEATEKGEKWEDDEDDKKKKEEEKPETPAKPTT